MIDPITNLFMVLLQAITNQGGISADWVLVGAFFIIGGLLIFIARNVGSHFTKSMDAITEEVKSLRTDVTKLQMKDVGHDAELINIKNEHEKYFQAIMAKLATD